MWIDEKILKLFKQDLSSLVYQFPTKCVVLGSSNQAETELNLDNCQKDELPVYRRMGGGGAVILHPGCVILSVSCWVKAHFENKKFFDLINTSVVEVLKTLDEFSNQDLNLKGISDIAIGQKKILGCSLFRSKNYLLYQGSLLFDSKLELIEKYLAHPSKEPEYREKRSHKDFLTDLKIHAPSLETVDILRAFDKNFLSILDKKLQDELIASQPESWPHLEEKLKGLVATL